MAMLKIPGYENQRPGEVPLSAVRDLLGDCRRCPQIGRASCRERV